MAGTTPHDLKGCFAAFHEVSRSKHGAPFDLAAIEREVATLQSKKTLPYDESRRRPLLYPARHGRGVDHGRQGSHPVDAPLLAPLPSHRGPAAPRGDPLQPRQSAASAGLAGRHPELVPHEPPAAAVQDGRTPHPACPVLHPATRRTLLDTAPVPADRGAYGAARMAPDVIGRTAPLGDNRAPGRECL
jgi:hypothetical protein